MFPWVQSVAFFLVASEKCNSEKWKDSTAQRKGPCKQQSLGTWGLPLRSQENILISKEAWQACLAAVPRSWAVPHARPGRNKVPVSYLRAGSTSHSLCYSVFHRKTACRLTECNITVQGLAPEGRQPLACSLATTA